MVNGLEGRGGSDMSALEILEVHPFEGCGKIKLGMTIEEVEAVAHRPPGELRSLEHVYPHMNACDEWYDNMRYYVAYINGRVAELVVNGRDEVAPMLYGVAVLQEKAVDVIAKLRQHAPCIYDRPDIDLSYSYYFEDIGITLWREGVYHPKMMEDAEYRQNFETMCPENQAEELSYQYFQTISLESRELQALKKRLGLPNL